jgi:hypothetical protein
VPVSALPMDLVVRSRNFIGVRSLRANICWRRRRRDRANDLQKKDDPTVANGSKHL